MPIRMLVTKRKRRKTHSRAHTHTHTHTHTHISLLQTQSHYETLSIEAQIASMRNPTLTWHVTPDALLRQS